MKLNSYLVKSRHGIYYLRLQRNGFDKRISLRTQDFMTASIAAYKFGATISSMTKNSDENKMKFATEAEVLV